MARAGATTGWQMVGAAAMLCWATVVSLLTLVPLLLARKLRLDEKVERFGQDMAKIDEPGYHPARNSEDFDQRGRA